MLAWSREQSAQNLQGESVVQKKRALIAAHLNAGIILGVTV